MKAKNGEKFHSFKVFPFIQSVTVYLRSHEDPSKGSSRAVVIGSTHLACMSTAALEIVAARSAKASVWQPPLRHRFQLSRLRARQKTSVCPSRVQIFRWQKMVGALYEHNARRLIRHRDRSACDVCIKEIVVYNLRSVAYRRGSVSHINVTVEIVSVVKRVEAPRKSY